jgi:AraC-like DNA-binding protein
MIAMATQHGAVADGAVESFNGFELTAGRGAETCYQRSIYQSIEYMLRHQDQPLQVSKLASVSNISPSHYFAVFKRVTGFAPIDFFIRLRMQRACELLESTTLCVKEVAGSLGYDDPFYFSRVFKSVNGMAPTDYRKLDEPRRRQVRATALPVRNGCATLIHASRTRTETHSQFSPSENTPCQT